MTHTAHFACPLEAEGCLKRFRSQNDLDVHLRRHRGEKPYVCAICAGTYSMRSEFKEHMKSHAGESEASEDIVELKGVPSAL